MKKVMTAIFSVFAVIGIVMIIGSFVLLHTMNRFEQNAYEVDGVITDIEIRYGSDDKIDYDVYVKFWYDGEEFEDRRISSYSSDMYVGKEITLMYNPNYPDRLEIKASISKVITKISNRTTSNGSTYTNFKLESGARKKLNYDAVLRESTCQHQVASCDTVDAIDKCYSIYTYDELEKALGIEILKNDLFKDNRIVVTKVSRKDEKISYLRFSMPNPMDVEKNSGKTTKVYMEIIMRTKYNTSSTDTIWEANLSSEKNIKEYYIKSINDKAYIFYTFSHTQSVFIIHDDILYRLKISIGDDYSSNPDKAVQKILEAFHY